jgi:hypothetical protein
MNSLTQIKRTGTFIFIEFKIVLIEFGPPFRTTTTVGTVL